MPLHYLKFKADLENIKQLIPLPDNEWKFDVQTADGCDTREGIIMCKSKLYNLEDSKGDANIILKWHGNPSQTYIKILDLENIPGTYTHAQSGEWVTVLAMECRGVIPKNWQVGRDFIAESTAGNFFDDVDLSEGDWVDFDEEGGEYGSFPVSITNVECAVE